MSDEFEIHPAARQSVRLRIMVIGASGAGKTESMLRLGTGIARVLSDSMTVLDTQDQAANWYADKYKFGMLNFRPPHDGDRFLRAIQFAATKSKVIGVDTLSDEHEGEGGMLEVHDAALDRLVMDKARRDGISPEQIDEKKLDGGAWREAKEARKRLIRGLRFVDAHIIFTVRAKEASKIFAKKGRQVTGTAAQKNEDGWVAVTDDDFLFECPIRMLMLPMSNGVPCWDPVAESERKAIRRPGQFDTMINKFKGQSLCEEMGAEMARWAMGDSAPKTPPAETKPRPAGEVLRDDIAAQITAAESHVQLDAVAAGINAAVESKKFGQKTADWLLAKIETKRSTLSEGA